jgi:hypothetical protein
MDASTTAAIAAAASAVATIFLVGLTARYVWLTHQLADGAAEAARHAERAADAAHRALLLDAMPQVLPVLMGSAKALPLRIENVSRAVAYNVELQDRTGRVHRSWSRVEPDRRIPSITGLDADAFPNPASPERPLFLRLEFSDHVGQRYRLELLDDGSGAPSHARYTTWLRSEDGTWQPLLNP